MDYEDKATPGLPDHHLRSRRDFPLDVLHAKDHQIENHFHLRRAERDAHLDEAHPEAPEKQDDHPIDVRPQQQAIISFLTAGRVGELLSDNWAEARDLLGRDPPGR